MEEFMRDLLGSGWAYYVAFSILFVWWIVAKANK